MKHQSKIALALCAVTLSSVLMTGMGYSATIEAVHAQSPILLETPVAEWHRIRTEAEKASAALQKRAEEQAKAEAEKAKARRACAFTDEEVTMMEYIIQQEVRGASLKHKRIIANVIVNRVNSDSFPDTVEGVLFQKGQFTSAQNYYNRKYPPDEDTKRAVQEVLNRRCEDLSQGALYFYAPRWTAEKTASWFENKLDYLFELEGHRFFR